MEYPSLDKPIAGAFRFNTDSSQLEIYDGNQWTGVLATSPNQQTGGARGVFFGRAEPTITDRIDYVNISTTGDAQDFGDLSGTSYAYATSSSRIRGFCAGGINPHGDVIDFITFSSTGNATDTGNLTQERYTIGGGCSDATRSIYGGGQSNSSPHPLYDILDYITSASGGDAVDFGNLSEAKNVMASASSQTRGLWAGGTQPSAVNTIDYVTIATTGNVSDFGDLSYTARETAGCSNATRGLVAGGYSPNVNIIEYVTMSTLGNSLDFGDMTMARSHHGSCSSSTRGLFASNLGNQDSIDYVQIMTTGNAADFGDLTAGGHNAGGTSNAHGGL